MSPTLPPRRRVSCPLPVVALAALCACAVAQASDAPAPVHALDEVVVSAHRYDRRTLEQVIVPRFVQSHTTASPVISQIGRWQQKVCPEVTGLKPEFARRVEQRLVEVARGVGAPAPTPADGECGINIEVVFTPVPQKLLDHIARDYGGLLGFHYRGQTRQVASFHGPIQAWYVTGTRSMNGYTPPVAGLSGGQSGFSNPNAPFNTGLQVDSANRFGGGTLGPSGTAGSHLGEGLRSEFVHVLVVADNRIVASHPLGAIADYVSMLALTHLSALNGCSELPSIVDLFSSGCQERPKPESITTADSAFLQALYGADLEPKLNIERGEMRNRMLAVLEQH